ncbi:MAG: response regulator [Ilumatobacteraceae bacterium]
MHILVAADADYVINDIVSALSGPDTSFTICHEGRDVSPIVAERKPDLVILDLQIGSMGGMAATMALRLDASAGKAPDVKILMLLDRKADIHLAKRSATNAWLVKPFDVLTLQRAVQQALAEQTATPVVDTAESEPVPAG